MAAKLVAVEGALKGLVLNLEEGDQWVIGRDPDSCQLLVEDPVASRRHLICRRTPEGISIENLSATNPILVNHEQIEKPRLLANGDLVKIGSGSFRFYSESEARLFNETEESQENHAEAEIELPSAEESSEEAEIEEQPVKEEEFAEAPPEEAETEEEPADQTPPIEEEPKEIDLEEAPLEEDPYSEPLEPETFHEEIFNDEELREEIGFDEDEPFEEKQGRSDTIFNEEADEEEELLANIDFETSENGRWLLKVIGGPNTGAEFFMQSDRTYVAGTDPNSCDVVFNDTSISRQHARLAISEDDIITIEDLKSRNGTLVDGKRLTGKEALQPNVVVNLGTTAFVIFDREGEMQTIISPLLPSIVKVLQQEEAAHKAEEAPSIKEEAIPPPEKEIEAPRLPTHEEIKEKSRATLTAFIFIAIITGTFVLMGIGVVTLFKNNPVELNQPSDIDQQLAEALAPFPGVEKSYNRATGTLMVIGHVLNDNGWRQLEYNLRDLTFIKDFDMKGVVIDQKVIQEFNPVLAKQNSAWRSVSLQAPAPGQFVLIGYLKTRPQMEALVEYMTTNFLYLDRLQYRVVVEEDVVAKVKLALVEAGIANINVAMNNGDLVLKGVIATKQAPALNQIITTVKQIPGIRNVQDLVSEIQEDRSAINISDRYLVTGVSRTGADNISVIIDGRIVSKGDALDGMIITDVTPQAMLLEKGGVKYIINLH